MGRPSKRDERRRELVAAFARVLADHGYAGATVAAVAAEAGVAPGLVHHYFDGKHELLEALLDSLLAGFRARVRGFEHEGLEREGEGDPLLAYVDGALKLDARADVTAARCWVGVLAEAVRDPALFRRVRGMVDVEIAAIQRRSGGRLSDHDAGAILAYILGALVLGAFAPKKVAGFAAPGLRRLVASLGG